MDQINSLQNLKVKQITSLKRSRERKKTGLFIIEGEKELALALRNKVAIEEIFFSPDLIKKKEIDQIVDEEKINLLSKKVFNSISFREHPDGVMAIAKAKYDNLDKVELSGNPLVLVVEAIEKPGNLGAILRTAAASKVDAVIVNEKHTDIYNPNVIRSSLGAVFSQKVVVAGNDETYNWLKLNKIISFATTPEAKTAYYRADYKLPTAILIGSEHTGLSQYWLKKADNKVLIPMDGQVDSLNASVSAAILLYEAKRQRNSH